VFLEYSAQFASHNIWFPASRQDDVSYRPDVQLSKAPAVRMTCYTVRTHIRLKHHPSGRYNMMTGVRTRLSIRQVSQFKSRRPDASHHGPEARVSNMEIACIRSTVRTTILLVQMRKAFIWKLLAANVQPSRRQGNTVQTRLSKMKDFQRNFQNFGRTFVCPNGL